MNWACSPGFPQLVKIYECFERNLPVRLACQVVLTGRYNSLIHEDSRTAD